MGRVCGAAEQLEGPQGPSLPVSAPGLRGSQAHPGQQHLRLTRYFLCALLLSVFS